MVISKNSLSLIGLKILKESYNYEYVRIIQVLLVKQQSRQLNLLFFRYFQNYKINKTINNIVQYTQNVLKLLILKARSKLLLEYNLCTVHTLVQQQCLKHFYFKKQFSQKKDILYMIYNKFVIKTAQTKTTSPHFINNSFENVRVQDKFTDTHQSYNSIFLSGVSFLLYQTINVTRHEIT